MSCVIIIVSLITCAVACGVAILLEDRVTIRRQRDIFSLWLDFTNCGQSILRFFYANNVRHVVIVGLDKVSERIIKALFNSDICLEYVVDDRFCDDKMDYLPGVKFVSNSFFETQIDKGLKTDMVLFSYTENMNKFISKHSNVCFVESIERMVEICCEMEPRVK